MFVVGPSKSSLEWGDFLKFACLTCSRKNKFDFEMEELLSMF